MRKHEAYAFSDALNDLGLQSNSMFAWHGMMFADEQLCGKPMKTIRLCNSTLEASLYLKAFILNGKYQVKAEYNSNEYSEEIIRQYLPSAICRTPPSRAGMTDIVSRCGSPPSASIFLRK